jgi:hypothetical protein
MRRDTLVNYSDVRYEFKHAGYPTVLGYISLPHIISIGSNARSTCDS